MTERTPFECAQRRALASGLGLPANTMLAGTVFDDLRPDEVVFPGANDAQIVCSFLEGEVLMTPTLGAQIFKLRQKLGRPLTAADLSNLDGPDGAVDDYA